MKTFLVSVGWQKAFEEYIDGWKRESDTFTNEIIQVKTRGQARSWAASEWDVEFTSRMFIRELKNYNKDELDTYDEELSQLLAEWVDHPESERKYPQKLKSVTEVDDAYDALTVYFREKANEK